MTTSAHSTDPERAGDPRHPDHEEWLLEWGRATYAASRVAGICFDLARVFGNVDSAAMYSDPLGGLVNRLKPLGNKGSVPGLAPFTGQLEAAREDRNDLARLACGARAPPTEVEGAALRAQLLRYRGPQARDSVTVRSSATRQCAVVPRRRSRRAGLVPISALIAMPGKAPTALAARRSSGSASFRRVTRAGVSGRLVARLR